MNHRIIIVLLFSLLIPLRISAAPFSPEPLRISIPSLLGYSFDLTGVYIPFTVSGTEAEVIFSISTMEKYASVRNIRNGYLGWHYLNGIDTCVYVSVPRRFPVGRQVMMWDGKGQDGRYVEVGTYRYHFWGYDPATSPETAARHIPFDGAGTVQTLGSDGLPIPNPVLYPAGNPGSVICSRWVIGSDPEDATLLETTLLPDPGGVGTLTFDWKTPKRFFAVAELPGGNTAVRGYTWTPNGTAALRTDWGSNGSVLLETGPASGYPNPGLVDPYPASERRFHAVASGIRDGKRQTMLYTISTDDGAVLRTDDLTEWWVTPDGESAGPTTLAAYNGVIALGSSRSCLHMLIDPGEYEDWQFHTFVRYANGYGDGVGEIVADETPRPWSCLGPESPPHARTVALDRKGFVTFPADGLSGESFGLLSRDGTGLGYFAFAGESGKTGRGHLVVEYGSVYDGFYLADADSGGVRYVAQNSVGGIITTDCDREYTPHFRHSWGPPGENATIRLDERVFYTQSDGLFSFADEVGVFTPSGICAGSARFERCSRYFTISVRSDDPSTPEVEGMREGEPFTFRLWDIESGREYPLAPAYGNGETVYRNGGQIELESLIPDASARVKEAIPAKFALLPNSPNPFNPSTTIAFTLPRPGTVTLSVYEITGRKVADLARGFHAAGKHEVVWNATGCASGVYFCVLKAGNAVETRKMLLMR